MKKLFFITALCSTSVCFSQRFSAELFGGVSNYTGDFIESKYSFQGAKAAFGFGLGYQVTDHIAVRGMFSFTKLGADDKNNNDPYLLRRNLNFKSSVAEFTVMGQYFIFNTSSSRINPYVTAGLGLFHFNPYTSDTSGVKHYLKLLSTEGQGLSQYPDRKPYSLTQVMVPFGAGVRFRVTENVHLGWEVSLRKTFTDYVDDLSGTYVNEDVLRAAKGDKAVELAYRSGEIKDGNPVYPVEGTTRGGQQKKDWYYFSGITASFRIGNGDLFGGKRSGIGCPTPVF